jgi:hypothetical protein
MIYIYIHMCIHNCLWINKSNLYGVTFALCINVIGESLVGSQYTVNGIHFSDKNRYDIHIYTYKYT